MSGIFTCNRIIWFWDGLEVSHPRPSILLVSIWSLGYRAWGPTWQEYRSSASRTCTNTASCSRVYGENKEKKGTFRTTFFLVFRINTVEPKNLRIFFSTLQGMSEDVSINKFFDEAMVVELAQQAADLHLQMMWISFSQNQAFTWKAFLVPSISLG